MKMALARRDRVASFLSPTRLFKVPHEQGRSLLHTLLPVHVPALLVLAAVVAASLTTNVPAAYFLRDPAGTLHVPSYIGLVSNLGVLLWCASATVCFFASVVLRKLGHAKQWSSFFMASGLLTTVLMIDDLFMVHENVSEINWRLNEKAIYILYAGMFLIFLGKFWKAIASTEFLLLVLALGLLGTSMLFDQLNDPYAENVSAIRLLIEDGSKFLGIATWLVYFARTCLSQVLPSLMLTRIVRQEPHMTSTR
ncbi:MAG: hypothetical protein QOH93_1116 [Chloroflexia bacterium]|jgi:hypothetical protein|nr:hypothetical protein [Chloroflexia bacterium]